MYAALMSIRTTSLFQTKHYQLSVAHETSRPDPLLKVEVEKLDCTKRATEVIYVR
jgi:hypothetical protein